MRRLMVVETVTCDVDDHLAVITLNPARTEKRPWHADQPCAQSRLGVGADRSPPGRNPSISAMLGIADGRAGPLGRGGLSGCRSGWAWQSRLRPQCCLGSGDRVEGLGTQQLIPTLDQIPARPCCVNPLHKTPARSCHRSATTGPIPQGGTAPDNPRCRSERAHKATQNGESRNSERLTRRADQTGRQVAGSGPRDRYPRDIRRPDRRRLSLDALLALDGPAGRA